MKNGIFWKLFPLIAAVFIFILSSCGAVSSGSVSVNISPEPTPSPTETPRPDKYPLAAFVYFEEAGVEVKTFKEESERLRVLAYYPQTESSTVNDSITAFVDGKLLSFQEANGEGSMDIRFKTYRYNESVLSFVFTVYEYNPKTGLKTEMKTMVFDLKSGLELKLPDLFGEGSNYLHIISQKTGKHVSEIAKVQNLSFSEDDQAYIDSLVAPDVANFSAVAFSDTNFYVYVKAKDSICPDYIETLIPLSEFGDGWNLDNYLLNYYASHTPEPEPTPEVSPEPTPATTDSEENVAEEKYIAITFDDGPEGTNTPRLLEALAERNVKATFFMLGHRLEANADVVKRMYDEGHSIGNHSMNHKELPKLKYKDMAAQVDDTNALLESITGKKSHLLRPPYGARNQDLLDLCKDREMSVILWNVDPEDWKYKDAQKVADHLVEHAKPGAIMLVHDIYATSIDGAIMAIDRLKEQGYQFVTVDELLSHYQGMEYGMAYTNGNTGNKVAAHE